MSAVKVAKELKEKAAIESASNDEPASNAPATPTTKQVRMDPGLPPRSGAPKTPLSSIEGSGACKVLERQLAENVASDGEGSVVVAKTLIALAKARRAQGKIDAAVAHLERSLGILESIVLDREDAGVVLATLSELAGCCGQLGRLDDATALLKRALEVATGIGSRKVVELRAELKTIEKQRRSAGARRARSSAPSRSGSMSQSRSASKLRGGANAGALVLSPSRSSNRVSARSSVPVNNPTARTLYA